MSDARAATVTIVDRLQTYAGLAAAIVPCAIIVHLIAEAAALGPAGFGLSFIARHAYFAGLFGAAAAWFAAAAGVGRSATERRRRHALLRAGLTGRRRRYGIGALVAANAGFFVLTQLVEGVPVAAGSFWFSLVIAFAGSIAAALLVFFFGGAVAAAAVDAIIGCLPRRVAQWRTLRCILRPVVVPRHATLTYSLIRPNRPPPVSPALRINTQSEGMYLWVNFDTRRRGRTHG